MGDLLDEGVLPISTTSTEQEGFTLSNVTFCNDPSLTVNVRKSAYFHLCSDPVKCIHVKAADMIILRKEKLLIHNWIFHRVPLLRLLFKLCDIFHFNKCQTDKERRLVTCGLRWTVLAVVLPQYV